MTEKKDCDCRACESGCANVNRDWLEDAEHENGNYQNQCIACKHTFVGHKRRVLCKYCTDFNPYSVKKADVGLGSASDYPTAVERS